VVSTRRKGLDDCPLAVKTVLKLELRRVGCGWPSANTPLRRVSGCLALVYGYPRARLPRTQCSLARVWVLTRTSSTRCLPAGIAGLIASATLSDLGKLPACCRPSCFTASPSLRCGQRPAAIPPATIGASARPPCDLQTRPPLEAITDRTVHQEHLSAGAEPSLVAAGSAGAPIAARVANASDGMTFRGAPSCARWHRGRAPSHRNARAVKLSHHSLLSAFIVTPAST